MVHAHVAVIVVSSLLSSFSFHDVQRVVKALLPSTPRSGSYPLFRIEHENQNLVDAPNSMFEQHERRSQTVVRLCA